MWKNISTYYIVTSSDNKYSKKSDIKNKVYYYKDSANIKNVLKVVKEDLMVKTSSYVWWCNIYDTRCGK